jgi:hypothetical protein
MKRRKEEDRNQLKNFSVFHSLLLSFFLAFIETIIDKNLKNSLALIKCNFNRFELESERERTGQEERD